MRLWLIGYNDEYDSSHHYIVTAPSAIEAMVVWRHYEWPNVMPDETEGENYEVWVYPVPLPSSKQYHLHAWPHDEGVRFPLSTNTLATQAIEANLKLIQE